jgi:enoyl-CoA hydratase
MTYENLLITYTNDIALVTFNREKALNALNSKTLEELVHFFKKDAPKNIQLKGVILTGAGNRAFVAGADIKEFLNLNTEITGGGLAKRGQDAFMVIEKFPKPVVAAVNGFALGGGCELAMACHIRIAGETAKFGQPEVNLGIIPGYGGTQRLVQLVGKGKAMELILTADIIDANEAHRLGLANHVVPAGQEVAKATEIIEKIATKSPVAIACSIKSVNSNFEKKVDGYKFEAAAFNESTLSKDFKEGVTAFIEKRKANFVRE